MICRPNFNCRIETKGVSHIRCNSGNILETVQDKDVVPTDNWDVK